MRYLVWLSLVITFHILPLTSLHAQWNHLQSGDLLFVSDTTGMGQAVKASTGNYTHVAMVERAGDSLFVIDATQKRGVARRPIEKTFANKMPVEIYRLTVSFDTAAVIERAKNLIGKPYDNAFLPDNDAYYCSELVQAAFGDLFESKPMNWRDKEGNLPEYWQKHFKELGIPVPEGVLGTNPTDLSKSPLLRKL
jgi:cell wall-associated NlpC family hydrolase